MQPKLMEAMGTRNLKEIRRIVTINISHRHVNVAGTILHLLIEWGAEITTVIKITIEGVVVAIMPRHRNFFSNNATNVYVMHLVSPTPRTRRGRPLIENCNMPKKWKNRKRRKWRRRQPGSWNGKGFERKGGMPRSRGLGGKEGMMMKGIGRRRKGVRSRRSARREGGAHRAPHPAQVIARVPTARHRRHRHLAATVLGAVHRIHLRLPTPVIVEKDGAQNLVGAARVVDAEDATAAPHPVIAVEASATHRVRRRMQIHARTRRCRQSLFRHLRRRRRRG